jgi:hypothetical protein
MDNMRITTVLLHEKAIPVEVKRCLRANALGKMPAEPEIDPLKCETSVLKYPELEADIRKSVLRIYCNQHESAY